MSPPVAVPPTVVTRPPPPKPDLAAVVVAEVEALYATAQRAVLRGKWGKAMLLCQRALRLDNAHAKAINVCAVAACKLRNVSLARFYLGSIKDRSTKKLMRTVCLREGVDIDDKAP
jgi:hypothetical protein